MDTPACLDAIISCPTFYKVAGIRGIAALRASCKQIYGRIDMLEATRVLYTGLWISQKRFYAIFRMNFNDLPYDIKIRTVEYPGCPTSWTFRLAVTFPEAYSGYKQAIQRRTQNAAHRAELKRRRLERYKTTRVQIERARRDWVRDVFLRNKLCPEGPYFEQVVFECHCCSIDWAHQIMRARGLPLPYALKK